MNSVDINCDMGESYGNYTIGNDEAIFPHITSCNIACGMHAGDPYQIERTIDLAIQHQVQIGAHPGYPDLQGFGRRVLPMESAELSSYIKYQVSALMGLVASKGVSMTYVKPHGALYNEMARNEAVARIVVKAIKAINPDLKVMGLAGSLVKDIAEGEDMIFIAEAFADRQYEANGQLRSRQLEHAVIGDAEKAASQVLSISQSGKTLSLDGSEVPVTAQSFCIHGDNPAAISILNTITEKLSASGITKKHF
ncbi:5-oxoprolinase subunit PxpA [Roseivirga sp.]|uniref:5-oxoprolinase subunit PxpA n=1 Tax=Roseivirga sp. TaxID=1964215 RepID=UPI003B519CA7